MNKSYQQYLYAAIPLSEEVTKVLVEQQRDVSQQLKEKDVRHKLLPQRMFFVPLFDFKNVPQVAHEALVLAMEQIGAPAEEIGLEVTGLKAWPCVDQFEQVVASVTDAHNRLANYREAIRDRAACFGFEFSSEAWEPIVPLVRISDEKLTEFPTIERALSTPVSWPVMTIDIMGRNDDEQRARFIRQACVDLSKLGASANTNLCGPSEDEVREEIRLSLLDRIENRKLRLSESRRNERVKAARNEKQSDGPQQFEDDDD